MILSDLLKKSWDETTNNFGFYALLLLLYTGILLFLSLVMQNLAKGDGIFVFFSQVVIIIAQAWLDIGLIIIFLKKARSQKTSVSDLFNGMPFLSSYLGALILYFLMLLGGTFLLVIPAFIWGIKYMFYPYFIVDKNLTAIGALKASGRATRGSRWDLLGMMFVLNVITVLGLLALVVGIFWAFPVAMLCRTHIYLKLAKNFKQ
jgi:hypothetical protein